MSNVKNNRPINTKPEESKPAGVKPVTESKPAGVKPVTRKREPKIRKPLTAETVDALVAKARAILDAATAFKATLADAADKNGGEYPDSVCEHDVAETITGGIRMKRNAKGESYSDHYGYMAWTLRAIAVLDERVKLGRSVKVGKRAAELAAKLDAERRAFYELAVKRFGYPGTFEEYVKLSESAE